MSLPRTGVPRLALRRGLPTSAGMSKPSDAFAQMGGLMAFINADDAAKEDLLVPGNKLVFTDRKTLALPTKNGTQEYSFNEWSFAQFASMLKIPGGYLETCPPSGKGGMKDQIEMRMTDRLTNEFMVRIRKTEDLDGVKGIIRAVLPGNYAVFDNRHLVTGVQRAIKQVGDNFTMLSSNAQDPRSLEQGLNMRFVRNTKFQLDGLDIDDPHQIGFHCRSSEIGAFDISLDALVHRLICTNGMMGWGDSEVLKIKNRNLQAHEITPRIYEGVMASIRQEEPVKEMLTRTYTEHVGGDPMTQLLLLGKKMKASDFVIESAQETFRRENHAEATRYNLMQSFTQVARGLPLAERLKIEESVGRVFFGGGRKRGAAIIAEGVTVEEPAN